MTPEEQMFHKIVTVEYDYANRDQSYQAGVMRGLVLALRAMGLYDDEILLGIEDAVLADKRRNTASKERKVT